MVDLDELGVILFKGAEEKGIAAADRAPSTNIIYGTALADSEDGFVQVQLDDAIYADDDLEDDDYEYVALTDEDDDINGIEEDEELIDDTDPDYDENDEDIVYWEEDDDDSIIE